jgi:membrane associated rhomboid family serine protease
VIPLKDDNPAERTPVVTYALVVANAVAFLWQLQVGVEISAFRGGAIPYEILTLRDIELRNVVAPPFTILTSMFLHGGFVHLGFNMLSLWIFGNNVEDALGRVRFASFYVLSGIAAALAQTFASAASGDVLVPMVGASGAIAGVLAAYLVLFPFARVLTLVFVFLVEVPAMLFLVTWFLLQLWLGGFSLVTPEESGGVAFFAHIGGFVFGLVAVRFAAANRRPGIAGPW